MVFIVMVNRERPPHWGASLWKAHQSQHIELSIVHQRRKLREVCSQLIGNAGGLGGALQRAGRGVRRQWAYNFGFDACANGQQLKCLTVIDEYTLECSAIDVANIRSGRVIEIFSKRVSTDGAARYLRSTTVQSSSPEPFYAG